MEQKIELRLNELFKMLEEEIGHATSQNIVKLVYEHISEAEVLNNLLCDYFSIPIYTNNISRLQGLKEKEDNFIFNFISKQMEEDPSKNWKAVFNYLRNTSFE